MSTYLKGMERLLGVVQELSMARSLEAVQIIVRNAARELTGADGATFVLRDNGKCYYADENAIAPLWKGLRFPLETCISGWSMLHRETVVIEDIYADQRIPHDAYRPTFVKSLAMTPIRRMEPIGAIGIYWAINYKPTEEQLKLVAALADATSVAMENVELVTNLERRVEERTSQLVAINEQLEAFSAAVSHDLRAPLRSIGAFSALLREDFALALGDSGTRLLGKVEAASTRMSALVEGLLALSKVSRQPVRREKVDLSQLALEIVADLRRSEPARDVTVVIEPGLVAYADPVLVRIVLDNLLGNAWKYSRREPQARIEVGTDGPWFFVRDNGAGFAATDADKLFAPFHRLHTADEFEGTGVGLATVQRIVHRHGGEIRGESTLGNGATFSFTLGRAR